MSPANQVQAAASLGAQPEIYTPEQSSRQTRLENPEPMAARDIGEFILRFENWLFGEFRLKAAADHADTPDPVGLTTALLSWINEMRALGIEGALHAIRAGDAAKLGCLLNHALDNVERHYRGFEISPAIMMLALSPVDDILVFLSLTSGSSANSE